MISQITKQLCLCIGLLAASHIHATHEIIGHQENYDLSINASYQNDGNTVFNHINHTITDCGSNYLNSLLAHPTNDVTELSRRQDITKKLINRPIIRDQIKEQLAIIAEHEATLQSLWLPEDATTTTALKEFFYEHEKLKHLNTNPHALNLGFIAHTANLFMPIAEHAILHFLISDKLKKNLHIGCCPTHNHGHSHKDHSHISKKNSHAHKHDHESKTHSHKHGVECKNESTGAGLFYKAYNAAHMAVHIIGVKALITHVYQKMLLAKDIQKKLISVAKIVESIKAIEQLVDESTIHFSKQTHLTNHTTNPELISEQLSPILELLKKNDFKALSILPNIGNILAAYNLIKEAQEELTTQLDVIAEIDTYVSITELYTKHQNTDRPYCFANYVQAARPSIELSGYWNVLLQNKTSSGTNFEVGVSSPRHLIISGANGSGKSTLLKSLAIPIVLGQTIGLMPAQESAFTPFAYILTSMTHLDNITQGQSLFVAEITRANTIVKQLKQLSQGAFALVLLDEICKSTAFEKGQDSALSLVRHLGSYDTIISCSATHFPALALLEDESPEVFKNYQLQLDSTVASHPTYQVTRGFSKSKNAFDIIEANGLNVLWN